MNDKTKKIAIGLSSAALAIAMGLQTFVFGQSDLQKLKSDVTNISQRIEKLEGCCGR